MELLQSCRLCAKAGQLDRKLLHFCRSCLQEERSTRAQLTPNIDNGWATPPRGQALSPCGRSLPRIGLADWLRLLLLSRGEVREFCEDGRRLSFPLWEDSAGNPKRKSIASLLILGASKIFALPRGLIEVVGLLLLLLL